MITRYCIKRNKQKNIQGESQDGRREFSSSDGKLQGFVSPVTDSERAHNRRRGDLQTNTQTHHLCVLGEYMKPEFIRCSSLVVDQEGLYLVNPWPNSGGQCLRREVILFHCSLAIKKKNCARKSAISINRIEHHRTQMNVQLQYKISFPFYACYRKTISWIILMAAGTNCEG